MLYFFIKVLQRKELNYSIIEKLTLSFVYITRRLHRYFQAHPILVLTNRPIRQILMQLEILGQITKWPIELGEYDISYKPWANIKGQAFVTFLTEIIEEEKTRTFITQEQNFESMSKHIQNEKSTSQTNNVKSNLRRENIELLVLYIDRASKLDGQGAGIILTCPQGDKLAYALRFKFSCSNNKAEYETLLVGLCLA